MTDFLEKTKQNELKERYTKELMKFWNEENVNGPMTKHCLSVTMFYVPVLNEKYIISIDKERIRKNFYFGYSDCGQGLTYEENTNLVKHVRNNLESHFMSENMTLINDKIKYLKEYLEYENMTGYVPKLYVYSHYYAQSDKYVMASFSILNPSYDNIPDGAEELSFDDMRNIIKAYEKLKVEHEKKLKSYLKRYGTKHMHVSTYWVDR